MRRASLALALLLLPGLALAWSGKTVGVSDGDTITVMRDKSPVKIRLYGVDCPEKSQAFGQKAKQFTSSIVFNQIVEVETMATDRYGRSVGIVHVGNKTLNEELLKAGFAWLYQQYCKKRFCHDWAGLADNARGGRLGLWADPQPTPPWDFRRTARGGPAPDDNAVKKFQVRKGGAPNNNQPATVGSYVGNVSSQVFHRADCRHAGCANCTSVFTSREEAIAAGFRPCGTCKP